MVPDPRSGWLGHREGTVGGWVIEPGLSPPLFMVDSRGGGCQCDNKNGPRRFVASLAPRLRWWAFRPRSGTRGPSNRGNHRATEIYRKLVRFSSKKRGRGGEWGHPISCAGYAFMLAIQWAVRPTTAACRLPRRGNGTGRPPSTPSVCLLRNLPSAQVGPDAFEDAPRVVRSLPTG